jgi:hypothetical protein|tara:strand:+ start:10521 stop:10703 length:183 start_codon:yes stop_codon:yes gene_type:complete
MEVTGSPVAPDGLPLPEHIDFAVTITHSGKQTVKRPLLAKLLPAIFPHDQRHSLLVVRVF